MKEREKLNCMDEGARKKNKINIHMLSEKQFYVLWIITEKRSSPLPAPRPPPGIYNTQEDPM